ncbi:hypothetical protein Tery_4581 [Trichodesmium erythraeum IMS101]|uniref:Uncharacterized protein n=1 Tax=Trichodesmium erythraeum (strain IMS101) TaxID=203124 RepID=Q10W17_TRIEI
MILNEFSRPLFWFPLVKTMIKNLFCFTSELVLILDRSQWQDINILMITVESS